MSRQVPGDKCGMVRMAFPESVSHVCMCRRYSESIDSECTCGVGKAVGKLVWACVRCGVILIVIEMKQSRMLAFQKNLYCSQLIIYK